MVDRGRREGRRCTEQGVRERIARPVRVVRALEVGDQAVHPLLEPTLLRGREPNVDERGGVLARRPAAMSSSAAWRSIIAARAPPRSSSGIDSSPFSTKSRATRP